MLRVGKEPKEEAVVGTASVSWSLGDDLGFSALAGELEHSPCLGHTQTKQQKLSGGGFQAPANWGGYGQTQTL